MQTSVTMAFWLNNLQFPVNSSMTFGLGLAVTLTLSLTLSSGFSRSIHRQLHYAALSKYSAAPLQHQNQKDQSQKLLHQMCGEQVTWQDVMSWTELITVCVSCYEVSACGRNWAWSWLLCNNVQVSNASTCLVVFFVSTVQLTLKKRKRQEKFFLCNL